MKRFTILLIFCFTYASVINIPAEILTVQQGIDAFTSGDTIIVAPGTYYESFDIREKNISVPSNYLFDEAPIMDPIHLDVIEDEPTEFSIVYDYPEGIIDENVTFAIIVEPLHGILSPLSIGDIDEDSITWFATYSPDENFFGEDSLEYIIINPNNPFEPGSGWIYFHVIPVNDLPQFVGTPDTLFFTLLEGDIWEYDFSPFVYDIEGDSIIFFPPDTIYFSGNIGLDDMNVDGNLFSYLPGNDFSGGVDFQIEIDDATEWNTRDLDSQNVHIDWIPVNDPPVLGSITAPSSIDEDSGNYVVTVTPTDIDIVEGIMDDLTLTYTILDEELFPVHSLDIETDVTDVERTITLTPGENQYGSAILQISVNDGELSDTDEIILTVNPINEAPIIDSIHVDVIEDETTEFAIVYEDPEAIIDENVTFAIIVEPLHGILSPLSIGDMDEDSITWLATYTPDENFFGEDSLEYSIINLNNPNEAESGWIYFHVLPVNDLPMLDELTNE